jgi:hypothetical protein
MSVDDGCTARRVLSRQAGQARNLGRSGDCRAKQRAGQARVWRATTGDDGRQTGMERELDLQKHQWTADCKTQRDCHSTAEGREPGRFPHQSSAIHLVASAESAVLCSPATTGPSAPGPALCLCSLAPLVIPRQSSINRRLPAWTLLHAAAAAATAYRPHAQKTHSSDNPPPSRPHDASSSPCSACLGWGARPHLFNAPKGFCQLGQFEHVPPRRFSRALCSLTFTVVASVTTAWPVGAKAASSTLPDRPATTSPRAEQSVSGLLASIDTMSISPSSAHPRLATAGEGRLLNVARHVPRRQALTKDRVRFARTCSCSTTAQLVCPIVLRRLLLGAGN